MPQPIETPDDIIGADRAVEAIFTGLTTVPGTLCRMAAKYLGNWGIRVSDANRKFIAQRGLESNLEDWESGTAEIHGAIENAIDKAGLEAGNKDMNRFLAEMAVPIIYATLERNKDWNHYKILDVGAGNGDTTIAILDLMQASGLEALAPRCHFYLIEPGYRKLAELGERLDGHPLKPKRTLVSSTLEEHMWVVENGHFDMAVANAVFHHMTTPAYLHMLNDKLTDRGVLAVGDWYTTIWSHPAFLVPVLQSLGASDAQKAMFRCHFGIKEGAWHELKAALTPEQRTANDYMEAYIKCLAEELKCIGMKSRVRLFEAHQGLKDNLADVQRAGFATEFKELSEKHDGFVRLRSNVRSLYPNNDIACVWAAAKVQQKNG